MKNSLAIISLLLGLTTAADFQDIPLKQGAKLDMLPAELLDGIDNSEKRVTVDLERVQSHRQIAAEKLLSHHVSVLADKNGTQTKPERHETGVALDSKDGLNFKGKVYLGSQMQPVNVAFSTVSTLSVINTQECDGCKSFGAGYDYQASSTVKKVVDRKMQYAIEGEVAEGVIVEDNVRLRPDEKIAVKEFPFLLVNKWKQTTWEKIDGIIGLSRSYVSTEGKSSGSAFLEALYQSGQIDRKIYSIHFDQKDTSRIEFGGYNQSLMVPDARFKFVKTPYDARWTMKIGGFKITDKPQFYNGAKNAYQLPETKTAVLDSFSPFIKVPKSYATEIFFWMLHGVELSGEQNDLMMGPCDLSKYHTINLHVNGETYFKLTPASYVIDIGAEDSCFIAIDYSEDDTWTLGEPFFRSFYSVFDDSKGIIGFAPSVNYPNSTIYKGPVPSDVLPTPGANEKKQQRENRKKIPPMSDPVGLIQYYAYAFGDWVKSMFGLSKPGAADEQRMSIGEGLGVFALITAVTCVCGGGLAYLGYEFYRSLQPQAKAGIDTNKLHEDNGVALGDLLTANDLEVKIAALDKADSSPISGSGKVVKSNLMFD